MKKAFGLGILASLFFAFTFVFNRSMDLSGGYWMWNGCLRYLFTLPIMWLIVRRKDGTSAVYEDIKKQPAVWFLWSTVGFGFFYFPLTMASTYGESWFVAATWQVTIVAGVLLTPLFGKKIPVRNLLCSSVILSGIFFMQMEHMKTFNLSGSLTALFLIIIGAFSYPLGNRKMMSKMPYGMTTFQRVYGMTLCSMPFWIFFSIVAGIRKGLPSAGQITQSLIVAVFSGVIATLLFFKATEMVQKNQKHLALIEATQCGEVIFTLIGGVLFLGDKLPSLSGLVGLVLIIVGMTLNSLVAN